VVIVVVALLTGSVAWLVARGQTSGPPPIATGTPTATPTATVVPTSSVTPTAPAAAVETAPPAASTVRQITFITGVSGSASAGYTIKLDFLSDLSGTKAGEAYAKAHGDEWPPPNDYYYVNQSKKVRAFAISSKVVIRLMAPDGSKKLKATVAQLRAHLLSGSEATFSASKIFYATIVDNKTVTRIDQQWVP
jgi:hypothetical protein